MPGAIAMSDNSRPVGVMLIWNAIRRAQPLTVLQTEQDHFAAKFGSNPLFFSIF
jgi:hypothetical protein